jgi:uncharacterized protein involved in outer membrane biogenesis
MLRKIILYSAIAVVVLIAAFILFFPLDSFVKGKIHDALGPDVSIKNFKIRWSSIDIEDVTVKTPDETEFLKIKNVKLKPYLLGFLFKRLEIKSLELDSPSLVIKRTKTGKWILPEIKKGKEEKGTFDLIIKSIRINGGNVLFEDDLKGFKMDFTNVAIDIKSEISLFQSGKTVIEASAQMPDNGSISIDSKGNIRDNNFSGVLSVRDLNMILLRPYMKGDVKVKKGRLNLDSKFTLDNGYVKAPSNLKIKDIDIETKGAIMGISAPLVMEVVKKKGELILDFNMWGRWNNLEHDLKESFQRKFFKELGRTVTSPLEEAVKGIGSLLPTKK